MAITVTDKNLGHATAYGYAKSKGYTGTEEEFAELMASYATVAEQAQQSAEEAAQSADNAEASATLATEQARASANSANDSASSASTANTKAQEASTSAANSAQSATQAAGSSTSASTSASSASQSASTASTKASEASTSASNAAISASNASSSASDASASATAAARSATQAASSASSAADVATSISASAEQIEQNTEIIKAISTPVTTDVEAIRADGTFINNKGEVGTTGSSFYTLTVDVTAGEKYIVNGYAAQNCFLYIFTDGTNTIYKSNEKGGTGGTSYSEIVATAPTGATKLIVDGNIGSRWIPAFIGKLSKFISTDSDKIPTAEVAIIPAPLFPHYPIIDSINKKVTVYDSTIIVDKRVSNGRYYTLNTEEIDYSSISSSAIGIYFDTVGNAFVADAYSTTRDGGRYLLFMLIRTSPVSVYHVTISAGFPVVIDGMIDGVIYSKNRNVRSVNHRGLEQVAPENTLIAFQHSKMAGFDYVETDIRFTQDGVPVLLHDATINRTARNADGTTLTEDVAIADITYDEVLTYDFGIWKNAKFAGQKIPTFEQFIRSCRNLGVHPYIELKVGTEEQIRALNTVVIRNGMKGKVSWISYNIDYLEYIHAVDARARLGVVTSDINFSEAFSNRILALKGSNEVFVDVDNANAVTNAGIDRLITLDLPLELYTGTIANIVNADPYITGFTLGAFNAGKELIAYYNAVG